MPTPRPAPALHAPPRSREYDPVVERIRASALDRATDDIRMQTIVDALWEAFREEGYSWVGFYLADEAADDAERLVLGPRRDKPACSPIGMHGVCGGAYATMRTQIVRDVRDLGEAYVPCDPRDASEIVIPVMGADPVGGPTRCVAVLDIDSHEIGAFDERDEAGLKRVLHAAGFQTA